MCKSYFRNITLETILYYLLHSSPILLKQNKYVFTDWNLKALSEQNRLYHAFKKYAGVKQMKLMS